MSEAKVGKRNTAQRELITRLIQGADGPLTVEEIHEKALEQLPKLGIATVYRAVKLLQEKGVIKSVTLPDGKTRFESADLRHHPHFQCLKCGQVFDLPECMVNVPKDGVLQGGFKVEDHELTLYGSCPECVD